MCTRLPEPNVPAGARRPLAQIIDSLSPQPVPLGNARVLFIDRPECCVPANYIDTVTFGNGRSDGGVAESSAYSGLMWRRE